ncbi:MAG: hypothetical protein RTU63_06020 [Candidatus Thorarchaeota archaeon]
MGKAGIVAGILTLLVGLAIFVDDLHDFVAGTEFLHWLPDFDPIIIAGFQFHHLYLGIIVMLVGFFIAARSDN